MCHPPTHTTTRPRTPHQPTTQPGVCKLRVQTHHESHSNVGRGPKRQLDVTVVGALGGSVCIVALGSDHRAVGCRDQAVCRRHGEVLEVGATAGHSKAQQVAGQSRRNTHRFYASNHRCQFATAAAASIRYTVYDWGSACPACACTVFKFQGCSPEDSASPILRSEGQMQQSQHSRGNNDELSSVYGQELQLSICFTGCVDRCADAADPPNMPGLGRTLKPVSVSLTPIRKMVTPGQDTR